MGRGVADRAAALEPSLTQRDRERIRGTLHASAGSDDIRNEIESGRLTVDHDPVGLGPLEGAAAPRAPKRAAKKAPPDSQHVSRARGAERMAERALEAAERSLEKKRSAAVRAQEELREAQEELAEAKTARAEAAAELRRADAQPGVSSPESGKGDE